MKDAEEAPSFEYEYDQIYKPFDFINKDLDLLFLVICLEGFKQGKTVYRLTDFFKGNYWDVSDVKDEALDTNDHMGIPDMVLDQLVFIFEDLRMGKVISVGLDDIDETLRDILIEVAETGPEEAKEQAGYFVDVVKQICWLGDLRQKDIEKAAEEHSESISELIKERGVYFTPEVGYFRKLQYAILHAPSHIMIEVAYDPEKVAAIEDEVKKYLQEFAKDKYVNEPAPYQGKRLYFTRQLENFHRYISKLSFIGDTVNIPFTILVEKDFEAVKILRYLEMIGSIKIRWADEGSWKVQFAKIPTTPESLLGKGSAPTGTTEDAGFKSGLSFDAASSTLTIGEYAVKIQGPDQRELLKILFRDVTQEWFYSEIAEIYDQAASLEDKKFYNAAYQLNGKVAKNTPIKDFLITSKQTVRINPKYLPKT